MFCSMSDIPDFFFLGGGGGGGKQMLGPDLVMKISLFIYLFIDPFFLILRTKGYFNMNPTHVHADTHDFNTYTCI